MHHQTYQDKSLDKMMMNNNRKMMKTKKTNYRMKDRMEVRMKRTKNFDDFLSIAV